MEIYADWNFYTNEYLQGRSPSVPESEFTFWAREASYRINRNRIEFPEGYDIPIELKLCTCEVAELLYANKDMVYGGMKGAITNERVGEYSVSYSDTKTPINEFYDTIQGVVNRRLDGTILHNSFVFRGVG